MLAPEFTLFETSVGRCGITWGARGVVGVQLPERHEGATRARLLRRYPDARESPPPSHIQQVIEGIVGLLRGEPRDFSSVTLDTEDVPPFHQQVYAVARSIPAGSTLSYGDIALLEIGMALISAPSFSASAGSWPENIGGRYLPSEKEIGSVTQ